MTMPDSIYKVYVIVRTQAVNHDDATQQVEGELSDCTALDFEIDRTERAT